MIILKRGFILTLALILILIGATFSMHNFHTIMLDMIFIQLEWPLIAILFIAFLIGVLLAWLLNAWIVFTQKRQIKYLNQQLADYKQEVSQLRQSPMNGIQ